MVIKSGKADLGKVCIGGNSSLLDVNCMDPERSAGKD